MRDQDKREALLPTEMSCEQAWPEGGGRVSGPVGDKGRSARDAEAKWWKALNTRPRGLDLILDHHLREFLELWGLSKA